MELPRVQAVVKTASCDSGEERLVTDVTRYTRGRHVPYLAADTTEEISLVCFATVRPSSESGEDEVERRRYLLRRGNGPLRLERRTGSAL